MKTKIILIFNLCLQSSYQVGFGVGGCLVDLPQTEESLSISHSTLYEEGGENHQESIKQQHRPC